jgi:hypothetical protein
VKTEHLIDSLSASLKPAKPLPRIFLRTLIVLVFMILGAGVVFVFFSRRPHLVDDLNRSEFFLTELFLLFICISTAYSLALAQLPANFKKNYLQIALFGFAMLALFYLSRGFEGGAGQIHDGLVLSGEKCSVDILIMSVLPFFSLFWLLKRSAPTNLWTTSFNIALCGAAMGAFLLRFSCPSDDPIHLFLWHIFIPLFALAFLGTCLGKKILKW